MFEGLKLAAGDMSLSRVMALEKTQAEDDRLEVAVREHARLVYRIAYSVSRNHHDAEDATQETFLRVLRYRRKLEGIDDPTTWIARIARRVAVEKARKRAAVAPSGTESVDAVAELRAGGKTAEELAASNQMTVILESLIAA